MDVASSLLLSTLTLARSEEMFWDDTMKFGMNCVSLQPKPSHPAKSVPNLLSTPLVRMSPRLVTTLRITLSRLFASIHVHVLLAINLLIVRKIVVVMS